MLSSNSQYPPSRRLVVPDVQHLFRFAKIIFFHIFSRVKKYFSRQSRALIGKCFECSDVGFLIFEYLQSWKEFALLSSTTRSLHDLIKNGLLNPVTIAGGFMSDGQLMWIASRCRRLESISAPHAAFGSITDRSLVVLATHCPNLRQLVVTGNKLVTDIGLKELVVGCGQLSHLEISKVQLSRNGLTMLAPHLANLVHLDVMNCVCVDDDSLVALSQHCHKLEHIDICHCGLVTDRGVTAVAASCPNLSVLNAIKCPLISDAVCFSIATHCRNMQVRSPMLLKNAC